LITGNLLPHRDFGYPLRVFAGEVKGRLYVGYQYDADPARASVWAEPFGPPVHRLRAFGVVLKAGFEPEPEPNPWFKPE